MGMTTAPAQPLLLQLLDPANRADPYRIFAEFRDRGPLPLAENNVAVFSTYHDCDEVLRHPSLKMFAIVRSLALRPCLLRLCCRA